MIENEFNEIIKNNIANNTVGSNYEPSLNPLEKKFSYKNTDVITIPLIQIGRINQSQLFTVITSTMYDKFESGYRYIFQHVSNLNSNSIDYGTEEGNSCDKIVIQNHNLGKIVIADGILMIFSSIHPTISSVICNKYSEQGKRVCIECTKPMSDNEDLNSNEVNFCPYTKYSNHNVQDDAFQDDAFQDDEEEDDNI